MRHIHLFLGCLALTAQVGKASALSRPIVPIRPLDLIDILTTPLLGTCTDANILTVTTQEIPDPASTPDRPTISKIKVKVVFKNLQLQDVGNGEANLTCSLYSKIPASFTQQGQTAKIASSVFTLSSRVPDTTISGFAKFQIGAVDAGAQLQEKDYRLAEGGSLGQGSASIKNPSEASIIVQPQSEDDGGDAIARTQVVLKVTPDGNFMRKSIPIAPGPAASGNSVSSYQNIVNEFTLSLTNTSPVGARASVVLESIELTLIPLEFFQ